MRTCLRELNGSIVIYLGYRVWARLLVFAMLAVWIKDNHHLVTHAIRMLRAFGILSFVVLQDSFSLTILYVFPIGLKGNI